MPPFDIELTTFFTYFDTTFEQKSYYYGEYNKDWFQHFLTC